MFGALGQAVTAADENALFEAAQAQLYAAPLASFAETRKALAAELRPKTSAELAKRLLACKKPTKTAWALDQVAHRHAAALKAFLAATDRVREEQSAALRDRNAAAVRETSRAFQAEVASVVKLAAAEAERDGAPLNVAQERAIGTTLHAVPFASKEDLQRLTRGTLTADLEAQSDFSIFGAMPDEAAAATAPAPVAEHARAGDSASSEKRRRAEEAEREANAAKEARARLEREAQEAERAAHDAEATAKRLEHTAAEAARRARELEEEARAARSEATARRATADAFRKKLGHA